MKNGSFRTWFFVCLMILMACSVYLATAILQDRQAQVERAEEWQVIHEQMQETLDIEHRVIISARDGYHADAYESDVDRITEQQLLALEYQMVLLQIIARQNAVMIELMLVTGP